MTEHTSHVDNETLLRFLDDLREGVANQNHAAEVTAHAAYYANAMRMAIEELKPYDPPDDVKDGPCCYELETLDDGSKAWISRGCDCGNYDDAQEATRWAQDKNRSIRFAEVLHKHGLGWLRRVKG